MFTLITAASTAAAYQLKNSLNSENVLIGDFLELPALLVKSGKMLALPDPENSSYTHQMLALCLDKNIDKVYALRKEEIELLLASKQLFHEYDIAILTQDDKI
jgi:hypothetical protein